jgi:hypothetical protein
MVVLVAVHVVGHSRWIASVAAGNLLSGGKGANGHGHESHRRSADVAR